MHPIPLSGLAMTWEPQHWSAPVPLSAQIVDYEFRPLSHEIDQRWTMGFAAAVGDARPEFIDTSREDGVIAHPLFTIALEWPVYLLVVRDLIGLGLSREDAMMATPLDHEVTLYRTIRPGQTLNTAAAVLGVQHHAQGSTIAIEWTTTRGNGGIVARSTSTLLFPGVPLASGPAGLDLRSPDAVIDLRSPVATITGAGAHLLHGFDGGGEQVSRRGRRRLGTAVAHVFGECANMWNPVHSDRAVAIDAGRPGLTMPPTGLLAMAVSSALQLAEGTPECVRRVRADFGQPVALPAELDVELSAVPGVPTMGFRVASVDADGSAALSSAIAGLVTLEEAPIDPLVTKPAREARPSGFRWARSKSTF